MKVLIDSKYGYRTRYVGGFTLDPGENLRDQNDWELVKKEDPRIADQITAGKISFGGKYTTWLRARIASDPTLESIDISPLTPQEASLLARYYEDDPLILKRLLNKAEKSGVRKAFQAQIDRTR